MSRASGLRCRMKLYDRQYGRCYLCNSTMVRPGTPEDLALHRDSKLRCEIEHVMPLSRGGKDAIHNAKAACAECNRSKDTLLPIDLDTPEGQDRALGLHNFIARMATCQPLRVIT